MASDYPLFITTRFTYVIHKDTFVIICAVFQVYSNAHSHMHEGKNCGENFPGGITNGAEWYDVSGNLFH